MLESLLECKINTKYIINSAVIDESNKGIKDLVKIPNIKFIEKGSDFEWIKELII